MRVGALLTVALLNGCVFGAEAEFFSEADGAQVFADGAQFIWSESGSESQGFPVVFRREGGGRYALGPLENGDSIQGILFVPILATPEEDYIAQLRLRPGEDGVLFAFVWRRGDHYRLVVDPGRLTLDDDLSAADPYCRWQSYQTCEFTSREDVFGVYNALIHPRFVVGDETPESYLDLLALDAGATAGQKGGQ